MTVISSSHYPGADVAGAFNGEGLTAGLHDDNWTHGWLTAGGGSEDEWVIIYLGAAYHLESLKFWNYNQAGFTTRGIQQADIFVANGGLDDLPGQNVDGSGAAFDPAGWTLFAENQIFNQSTGGAAIEATDDFDLNGQFVSLIAIRIDSSHGSDSVGFGEMQIMLHDPGYYQWGSGYSSTTIDFESASAGTIAGGVYTQEGFVIEDFGYQYPVEIVIYGTEVGYANNVIQNGFWNRGIRLRRDDNAAFDMT
jgi:hypothetical protein